MLRQGVKELLCIKQEELGHGRQLQQFLPPLPVVVPLPPFLTGGSGGLGPFTGSGSAGTRKSPTSLQSNSAANGNCTATWAGEAAPMQATK